MLDGKKTYLLVALAGIGALATYASGVVTNGFDLAAFWSFLQSEAMIAVFATLRMAIAKK
jgi:hypothetical protein